ncbi:hypothetical protein QCA50_002413 [Cerrena zonata]|uniref:Uncharacterized protein n=1 Tax=Cerrena zonata TaxID=2478898 RepID=A0AAW0GWV7_9APHY
MRSFLTLTLAFVTLVAANTEIVNIVAQTNTGVNLNSPYEERWPKFTPDKAEQLLHILPAPYGSDLRSVCEDSKLPCLSETWVALDLDSTSWRSFSKFTLRLSWPASSPADFRIDTYSPNDTMTHLTSKEHRFPLATAEAAPEQVEQPHMTRRLYARIRAVSTGLRRPSSHQDRVDPMQYILLLEPLYLGVLPASVVPYSVVPSAGGPDRCICGCTVCQWIHRTCRDRNTHRTG